MYRRREIYFVGGNRVNSDNDFDLWIADPNSHEAGQIALNALLRKVRILSEDATYINAVGELSLKTNSDGSAGLYTEVHLTSKDHSGHGVIKYPTGTDGNPLLAKLDQIAQLTNCCE